MFKNHSELGVLVKFVVLFLFVGAIFTYFPQPSPMKVEKIQNYLKKQTPLVVSKDLNITDLNLNAIENTDKFELRFKGKGTDYFVEGFAVGNVDLNGTDLFFYPKDIKITEFKKESHGIIDSIKNQFKELDSSTMEKIKDKLNIQLFHTATNLDFVDMKIQVKNNGDVTRIYYLMTIKPYIFWTIFVLTLIVFAKDISIMLISLYQEFISPHKGYKCARGVLEGNGTCSSITKKAFKEKGFIGGIKEYFDTTKKCKAAYKELKESGKLDKKCSSSKHTTAKNAALCGVAEETACCGTELGIESCAEASACDISGCEASACDIGACDVAAC